jgi:hypothetical protein
VFQRFSRPISPRGDLAFDIGSGLCAGCKSVLGFETF